MKKTKRILACVLVVLMLLTAAPLEGFVGLEIPSFAVKANAAGVSGYNASAAVQWAKDHVNDEWSCLYGECYWAPGTGDCANFVSQCIYMGGVNQNDRWNYSGYNAHYSLGSDGSWIRATQLHNYVVSIGGQEIRNPSVSQMEPGDLLFYKSSADSGNFAHCAIIIDVNGGTATVAAHTSKRNNPHKYTSTNFHLSFANNCTYLVKMYGGKCTDKVVRDFDVYTAGNGAVLYSQPNTGSTRYFAFYAGEYAHVHKVENVGGVLWGYTSGYGANCGYKEGWVKLSTLNYKCHVSTGPINHKFGAWYRKVQPTCSTKGIDERVCSVCGYTEQRELAIGGEHMDVVDATCINPRYCRACGEILGNPLGHAFDPWEYDKAPTCIKGGTEKRVCWRCGLTEYRDCAPLGHNYEALANLPSCTTEGSTNYKCTRCGDSYVEKSDWTGYSAINTSDSKYAEFLKNTELYRSRQEYRYRTKSTTTRTSTSSTAPTVSGYTVSGSSSARTGEYGAWSGWSESYPTTYDYREIQSGNYTEYFHWDHSVSDGTTRSVPITAAQFATVTSHTILSSNYHTVYLDPDQNSSTNDLGSSGAVYYYGSQTWNPYYNIYINGCNTYQADTWWYLTGNTKPAYRYRDRGLVYTFNYYKWNDWSNWSTSKQTGVGDSKQEETRTTYSFKAAALGHNWGAPVTVKPTCHEDGYTRYTCKRCGITMDTNITKALGDKWGEWYQISEDGVTPRVYRRDCTNFPQADGTCACGHYQTKIENCQYEPSTIVEPTCLTQGYTEYKCVLHGETYKADYVDALGHECDEVWVLTIAPTCTEEGLETAKCVRHDDGVTCDKTYTRPVKANGHDMLKTEAVAPTCLVDGNSEYYFCQDCWKYFSDKNGENAIDEDSWIISATGHNRLRKNGEETWITEVEAACGTTGRENLYCQNEWCDYTEMCDHCGIEHHELLDQREIAEITPDYFVEEHKDPKCNELGYDIWSCRNCIGTDHEHGWTDILTFTEHPWGEPVTVYPTCTESGYTTVTCTYCGLEDILSSEEATDHATSPLSDDYETSSDKMELISSVPNVCGNGSVDTYQCTHIDKNTGERCTYKVVIGENKDHTLGDYIVTKEPTCTDTGLKHKECINGDYRTEDEIIPETGHDWEVTKTVPPTCLEPGYDVVTCKNDSSHTYKDENVSSLGHDWEDEWVITKEPTILEKGEKTLYCKRDRSHTRVFEIPMLESFTVTFVVKGETVDKVKVPKGTKFVNEPDLTPYEEANTTVEWEEYELNDEDIIVNAVFTPIDPDDVSDIETEKTVDKFENGNALITLSASAASRTIKFNSVTTKPLDVVFVLDRSGSMNDSLTSNKNQESITKLYQLQNCVNIFLNALNENATATGADHRVALVGFGSGAGGYSSENKYTSLNYESTGVIATNKTGAKLISYKDISSGKWNDWEDAFMPIGNIVRVNPVLTKAVNELTANGATQTDLGLEMAEKILGASTDENREKLVILITDGDPTNYGTVDKAIKAVAPEAVRIANRIKANGTKLYTVGVKDNADANEAFGKTDDGIEVKNGKKTFDFNRFLNIVSSNYPDAKAMNNYGEKVNNGYYLAAKDTDTMKNIFSSILISTVYKTVTFKRATLVDTLSSDFTLTLEQENAMRENLKNTLDIADSDISVARNSDGTTTVRIQNVPAVKNTVNGKTVYTASVSFECSLNKNNAGEYETNTDDAYVEIGGEKVEAFEKPKKVTVSANRNIVVFKINGEVYRIWEGDLGDTIVIPETDLAKWTVDETVTGSYAEYEAVEISDKVYTVNWMIDGERIKQEYTFGDKIVAPTVADKGELEFKGWTPSVAYIMPAKNVTYTAVYGEKHVHSYKQTSFYGNCEDGVYIVSKCACGDEKVEQQAPEIHQFSAVIKDIDKDKVYERLTCDVCHITYDRVFTFNAVKTANGKETVLSMSLLSNGVEVQPNENGIKIMIPKSSISNLGNNTRISQVKVVRLDETGKETACEASFEDNYLVFVADHFSIYVITILDEDGNGPENPIKYADAACLADGHSYVTTVIDPTCTKYGYTNHTCSVCGDTYDDLRKDAVGHVDENNDGKCDICDEKLETEKCSCICHSQSPFMKFIYKIVKFFWKLFRIRQTCQCDARHW